MYLVLQCNKKVILSNNFFNALISRSMSAAPATLLTPTGSQNTAISGLLVELCHVEIKLSMFWSKLEEEQPKAQQFPSFQLKFYRIYTMSHFCSRQLREYLDPLHQELLVTARRFVKMWVFMAALSVPLLSPPTALCLLRLASTESIC